MSLLSILTQRLRLPVVASPLFIISNPDLVIAQCKAGIVGSFPALNARPAAALDDWLQRITAELAAHDRAHPDRPSAPFAVNQIVHRSNDRLDADMEVVVRHKVPIVITSLGARREINDAVHSYGGIVLHDVIDNHFARKAIDQGADGRGNASGAGENPPPAAPGKQKILMGLAAGSRKPPVIGGAHRAKVLAVSGRPVYTGIIGRISLRSRDRPAAGSPAADSTTPDIPLKQGEVTHRKAELRLCQDAGD